MRINNANRHPPSNALIPNMLMMQHDARTTNAGVDVFMFVVFVVVFAVVILSLMFQL